MMSNCKMHGPHYGGTTVLPVADAPKDTMIVEFYYWGDKWMWSVYYCVSTSAHRFMDVDVCNDNGDIHERSKEFGK